MKGNNMFAEKSTEELLEIIKNNEDRIKIILKEKIPRLNMNFTKSYMDEAYELKVINETLSGLIPDESFNIFRENTEIDYSDMQIINHRVSCYLREAINSIDFLDTNSILEPKFIIKALLKATQCFSVCNLIDNYYNELIED